MDTKLIKDWDALVARTPYLQSKINEGIVFSHYQIPIIVEMSRMENNIYVPACAGSGKSFTITTGAYVIPKSKKPIFLAFNSHIVKELQSKLPPGFDCLTCHSIGLRSLTAANRGRRLNVRGGDKYNPEKFYDKCRELVEELFPNAKWDFKKSAVAFTRHIIHFVRNTLTDYTSVEAIEEMIAHYPIDFEPNFSPILPRIKEIIDWGVNQYKFAGIIDFTDMIWLLHHLDIAVPKYDCVLVDEAQDLNASQHELLRRIVAAGGKVVVVGDPYQSMYAFSGAAIGSLETLKDKFQCKELPLSICYRCPKSHIELARFADGDRTEWRPNAPEGEINFVLAKNMHELVKPRDLIMCRLTAPLVSACIRFISNGIAATVLGRNIGQQITRLIDDAMKPTDADPEPKWEDFVERFENMAADMRDKLSRGADGELKVELFNDKADCVMACYQSPLFKTNDYATFKHAIEALFSDKENIITLCTVHRAKGLEADRVFIIVDKSDKDCMPFYWKNQRDSDLEQEVNIIYVALTRSKDKLYIVSENEESSKRHRNHFKIRRRARKNSVTEKPITVQIQKPTQNVQTKEESKPISRSKIKKGTGLVKRKLAFED